MDSNLNPFIIKKKHNLLIKYSQHSNINFTLQPEPQYPRFFSFTYNIVYIYRDRNHIDERLIPSPY